MKFKAKRGRIYLTRTQKRGEVVRYFIYRFSDDRVFDTKDVLSLTPEVGAYSLELCWESRRGSHGEAPG